MTDTPFSADEIREIEAQGFTVTGATEAALKGNCVVTVEPHGPDHFTVTTVLPGGGTVSGFVPRSAIVAPWGRRGSGSGRPIGSPLMRLPPDPCLGAADPNARMGGAGCKPRRAQNRPGDGEGHA
jgi:hypothetical protein